MLIHNWFPGLIPERPRPMSIADHLNANQQQTVSLLHRMEKRIMAGIDDIISDEASLRTSNRQLIQLMGNAIAEIASLKSQVTDPALQAKFDAVDAALKADLGEVTSALTTDGSGVDVPPAAPVPDTSGASGSVAASS